MNRKLFRLAAMVGVVVAALGGCSSSTLLEPDKIDYKSSAKKPVRSLEVPPDLISPPKGTAYDIPGGEVTYGEMSATQLEPEKSGVLVPVEGMHIERSGSQRWLVVRGTEDRLWPDIKDFWLEQGFILDVDQPVIGIMETDWAENRAKIPQDFVRSTLGKIFDSLFSTSERDKFRTRLEAGKEPGTVEIYVSHRGMEEVYADQEKASTIWQPRPADPELEAEMLHRLMVHLGMEKQRADLLMASQPEPDRAAVQNLPQGGSRLIIDEPFDRAWRRVGLALDRVSFTVVDRDRSNGIYFVRYVDPDAHNPAKNGLFSKLAFWKKDEGVKNNTEFRIQVQRAGSRSEVAVVDNEGHEDNSKVAQQILQLLQEQLR